MRDKTIAVAAGVVAVTLGALALWAESSAATIPECDNKWGYIVKDATTCERDPLAILAMVLGVGFAMCALTAIEAILRMRRERQAFGGRW